MILGKKSKKNILFLSLPTQPNTFISVNKPYHAAPSAVSASPDECAHVCGEQRWKAESSHGERVRTHTQKRRDARAHARTRLHVRRCAYMYAHARARTHKRAVVFMFAFLLVLLFVFMFVSVHAFVFLFVCARVFVCV